MHEVKSNFMQFKYVFPFWSFCQDMLVFIKSWKFIASLSIFVCLFVVSHKKLLIKVCVCVLSRLHGLLCVKLVFLLDTFPLHLSHIWFGQKNWFWLILGNNVHFLITSHPNWCYFKGWSEQQTCLRIPILRNIWIWNVINIIYIYFHR